MRVVLAIVCIGAVMFLLRVLAALVKEWVRLHSSAVRAHSVMFKPAQRRGQIIEMTPVAEKRKAPERSRERIAL
jgi:hypothetical protein